MRLLSRRLNHGGPAAATRRRGGLLVFALFALGCLANAQPASPAAGDTAPTVGVEGRMQVELSGPPLVAKPVDDRSKLVVRVVERSPEGEKTSYDFRYIGLVPGRYDLRDFLERVDGSAPDDLSPLPVEVAGLLPEDHSGRLDPDEVRPLPGLGGYRSLVIAFAVLWALLLVPLVLYGRKRRTEQLEVPPPPPPTLADRLRPLVELAARGELGKDGQAKLELLLLQHWCEKLHLDRNDMAGSVARMRQDPEAGALLGQLERWLHRPPDPAAEEVDVAAVLAPYRHVAAPAPVDEEGGES